jgi:predicted RNA polymerase sigma factor
MRFRRLSWPRPPSGPSRGRPRSPKAWLLTVASRRVTDDLRAEESRRRREEQGAVEPASPAGPLGDDTLTLAFLCCHLSLSAPSQLALTLRAVAGLTTAEIARALLVPAATMAQRISRAKQRIKAAGATFRLPPEPERTDRLQQPGEGDGHGRRAMSCRHGRER